MNKFKIYKESIDIDYYVYFTKAYFAFNAYLKYKYPNQNDMFGCGFLGMIIFFTF
jgi:hypothetical protein